MIGIFDSGFGGLSIFKEIETSLPNYDYIYLGDNKRAPYGYLEQGMIYQYVKEAVDYLFSCGVDLIILACNTASAKALRKLQQEYLPKKYPNKNVLGVIRPLAEVAALLSQNKKVAVIGTPSTIDSRAYINELKQQDKDLEIIQQACPMLVSLVEQSQERTISAQSAIKNYIQPLKNSQPDIVILGCTHYEFLQEEIRKNFHPNIMLLNSGQIVAQSLVNYLKRHPEFDQPTKDQKPYRLFLTTDDSQRFDQAATKFLGKQIKSQQINL